MTIAALVVALLALLVACIALGATFAILQELRR